MRWVRHQRKLANVLAQAIVGEGLDRVNGLEVSRVGDFLEQGNGRKAAWNDPVTGTPFNS